MEPHGGCDTSALRTRAVSVGDHWVLDGTKQSTANGKRAQAAIVSAVTDKDADENGVSGFLVFTDTPGYLVLRLEEKKDQRNSGAVAVAFDNFRIPAEPLPGSEVRLRE